jgi:hypothetical protein
MSFQTSKPNGFGPFGAPGFCQSLPARLGEEARDEIGAQLRAMYAALTREPVPERLVALLHRLGSDGAGVEERA